MALVGQRGGELTNAEVHQEMNRGCKYAASWEANACIKSTSILLRFTVPVQAYHLFLYAKPQYIHGALAGSARKCKDFIRPLI